MAPSEACSERSRGGGRCGLHSETRWRTLAGYGACRSKAERPREIKLPFDGAIQEMFINPAEAGVYVSAASWTNSPVFLHYDPKTKKIGGY